MRRSAGTEAVIGTMLGGWGEFLDWERISFTVSIDGWTVAWDTVSMVMDSVNVYRLNCLGMREWRGYIYTLGTILRREVWDSRNVGRCMSTSIR